MKPSLAKLLTLTVLCLGILGLISFGCQRQDAEKKTSLTKGTLSEFISEKSPSRKPASDNSPSGPPASEKPSSESSASNIITKTKSPSKKASPTNPTAAKPLPAWTQQSNPARSEQQILIATKVIEINRDAGSTDIPTKKYKGVFSDQKRVQEFLRQKSQQKGTETLTTPAVILKDGETATIEIINEFLYPTGPAEDAAMETENTGFTSYIKALHLGRDDISLKSFTRICEFEGFSEVSSDFSLPVFNRRDIETSDRLKSGETIVIGGVLDSKTEKIEDKFFFGLFKKNSTRTLSRELIILITATLVDSEDADSVSQ